MTLISTNDRAGDLQPGRIDRLLLAGGVLGPILFIAVFLIEGAIRPGYSVSRNYVSDLALSDDGWQQVANFIVCGLLFIGFAAGLRRIWPTGTASVWGPRLMALLGLGLVVAGLFVTDPARGYPPGAPLGGQPQTIHGWIHGLNGAVLFTFVLPATCLVIARRFAAETKGRNWATYSRITGVILITASVLSTVTSPLVESLGVPFPIGVVQRIQITIGWGWVALTALRLLRQRASMV